MKTKIGERLRRWKDRIGRRLKESDRHDLGTVMGGPAPQFEIGNRIRAVAAGGVALMDRLARAIGLRERIDERVSVLKQHQPYHESDHVLAVAYNLLAGGTCLQDLDALRQDEQFLDMLGARRLPDPTTAGDFCRRFDSAQTIDALQEAINEARLRVWRMQPRSFFDRAVIDVDGTFAETNGEHKEGIDLTYKKSWGYHVLVVSLANTEETLFLENRPGSRPSHEGAAARLDQAIALARKAGFREVRMRGDTDFQQTRDLDRWDQDGVGFVFGYDAYKNLVEMAVSLPDSAWIELERSGYELREPQRTRSENARERIVAERGLHNLVLAAEHVAEFDYRPRACTRGYRMVVVRKTINHEECQKLLWADKRYYFYITNIASLTRREVVEQANKRCNQERLIEQLKNGVHAMRLPVDNLHSNWAYMVMGALAWNLSRWFALALPETGRWKAKHAAEKKTVMRMRFPTFVAAFMRIPAQVIKTGRRIVVRVLSWNPWQHVFFRLTHSVKLLN